ncbi:proline transporter [Genlisea aurea]|uniref:Proline transporter n=1 Tax=Genlisea aurea TaxID=192259 RepID=S8CHR7_9LAMI|nr:proline transporter [Genlisea aurea]
MYIVARPKGSMELYQFMIIYGGVILILAQIPSFHATRNINLLSLLLVLTYAASITVASIYLGFSKNAPTRDYSIVGVGVNLVFGFFNGISVIATVYGNGIIPEIQATVAPPVRGKMFKGLLLSYSVVISTFFSVGISGYWAFGNQAQGTVLSNFILPDGDSLLPRWFIFFTSALVFVQGVPATLIYLQPVNVILENWFSDPNKGELSPRNVVSRLVFRSLCVVLATLLAAMLPFFGDFMALIGSFGFIPLDFILPVLFYNITFKSSVRGSVYWVNAAIAAVFAVVAAVGIVASVRQIVLDSGTYRLFANL